MRKSFYLIAIVAIGVLCLGFLAKPTPFAIGASTSRQQTVVDIDEIHRSIDMKALPITEVKEPF